MKSITDLLAIATPKSALNLFSGTLVSAAVLLTVSCAGNQTGSQQLSSSDPNVECLYIELTGTNIPKRYCRTKSEWEALSKVDRDVAKEYMRQTSERSGIMEQASDSPF